jgi:DtxR family Mn-dependent transcriptional regulator
MHPERAGEYLETIFLLARKNNTPARTTQIAAELNVSPPSVTEMIQRLSESGFVHYRPYYGVELTESGTNLAKKQRHTNRVLRRFLIIVLGMEPEIAKEEANNLQHTASENLLEHICQYMLHMQLCPECRDSKVKRCCNLSMSKYADQTI